jgi:hypothetical protein
LTALAMSETRAADATGGQYWEMAGRLRELARLTPSPSTRQELVIRKSVRSARLSF